jgi:hypothetical protein
MSTSGPSVFSTRGLRASLTSLVVAPRDTRRRTPTPPVKMVDGYKFDTRYTCARHCALAIGIPIAKLSGSTPRAGHCFVTLRNYGMQAGPPHARGTATVTACGMLKACIASAGHNAGRVGRYVGAAASPHCQTRDLVSAQGSGLVSLRAEFLSVTATGPKPPAPGIQLLVVWLRLVLQRFSIPYWICDEIEIGTVMPVLVKLRPAVWRLASQPALHCGQAVAKLLGDETINLLRPDTVLARRLESSFKYDDWAATADCTNQWC